MKAIISTLDVDKVEAITTHDFNQTTTATTLDVDKVEAQKGTALSDHLTLVELPTPQPQPREVRIRVLTSAVNPADILQSKGAYPPPPGVSVVLGLECAGVIDEVGSELSRDPQFSWMQPGQPVCALLTGGGYAEYVCVDARQVLPLPKMPQPADDPYVAAMGLVESAAASWLVLETIGGLNDDVPLSSREARARSQQSSAQPCDTHKTTEHTPTQQHDSQRSVLIHGASGGVGSVAVQLAAAWGHRVYATAGTPERCKRVQQLGATKCFDYHDDWLAELKQCEPNGVNVIMDVLGGPGLEPNVNALARHGHLVVLGLLRGRKGTLNVGKLLSKNASVTAQTLRSQSADEKAEIVRGLREDVWPRVESEQIRPVIGRVLPFSEVARAHNVVAGKHGEEKAFGKVILIRD